MTSKQHVIGVLTCRWVTPISKAEVRIYGTAVMRVIEAAYHTAQTQSQTTAIKPG